MNSNLHILKSNLDVFANSLSMRKENQYVANLQLIADLIEPFEDVDLDDEDLLNNLFDDFLYQSRGYQFRIDWKDVESMQAFFEFDDGRINDILTNQPYPQADQIWEALPYDSQDHTVPLILNVAREQLVQVGLDICVFNDGSDLYRGWITHSDQIDLVLTTAENLGLDIRVPDDEWFEEFN